MNNPNTPVPSVDTSKKSNSFLGMDFSNFDAEKFRKAYNLLNPTTTTTTNTNSTSGLSAVGSALSGIANAYMATDGFNFDKDKNPSANTNTNNSTIN